MGPIGVRCSDQVFPIITDLLNIDSDMMKIFQVLIGLLLVVEGIAAGYDPDEIKAEIDDNGKSLKVDRWWWSEAAVGWKGTDANSVYLVKKESASIVTALTGSEMPDKILNAMMKCLELGSIMVGAESEDTREAIQRALSHGVKTGDAVATIEGIVFTVKVQEVGESAFMSCEAKPK